jgi:DNA mismatch endonuclease (patch repair protein)
MTDRVTSKRRSQMMAAVRTAHTSPELYVRKKLFAAGFRYRLHAKSLAGKPDIVLPRFRLAVFVNGCFWHGHNCPRGKRPSSNIDFWSRKLDGNARRDQRNRLALQAEGWTVVLIWECELKKSTAVLLRKIRGLSACIRE